MHGVSRMMARAVAVLTIAAGTLVAQQSVQTGAGTGGSPHYKSDWTIGTAHISISYGRPYLKGRPEALLMPVDKPWRTGADTAAILKSDAPLTFGKILLAPGSDTINTHPGANGWERIRGKLGTPGHWGIPVPTGARDRPCTDDGEQRPRPQLEQLTIAIDHPTAGPSLRVDWGTTRVTMPFTVDAK